MSSHGAWSNKGQDEPTPSAVRVLVKILVVVILIAVPLLFINDSEAHAQGTESNGIVTQQRVGFPPPELLDS